MIGRATPPELFDITPHEFLKILVC